ncbi:MAG TPA: SCP2 sterol-binding domain-containing protein [Candidatus Thermoplasmatota archaeon]|nr:SCP2 sterol-binding domain-containing protein [Candidatus Thermoplasmatota archaeon]
MVQYLSPEWLTAVRAQVDKASDLEKEFKGVNTSLKNVVKNAPGGTRVVVFRWTDGHLTDALLGGESDVGQEKTEFTMSGEYPLFVRLNKGELDIKTAIMRRELRLDGNMLKALRLNRAFDVFTSVVRQVPAEY